jgi:hypothetical protein
LDVCPDNALLAGDYKRGAIISWRLKRAFWEDQIAGVPGSIYRAAPTQLPNPVSELCPKIGIELGLKFNVHAQPFGRACYVAFRGRRGDGTKVAPSHDTDTYKVLEMLSKCTGNHGFTGVSPKAFVE